MATADLAKRHCEPPKEGTPPLDGGKVAELMKDLPEWETTGKEIAKTYRFQNFYETMAFVNAIAWIANREDHHPDLEVGYNRCRVRFSTHSVGGLSDNDFISAARIELLQA